MGNEEVVEAGIVELVSSGHAAALAHRRASRMAWRQPLTTIGIPIIGTVSKDINAAHRTANDPSAHAMAPALGK